MIIRSNNNNNNNKRQYSYHDITLKSIIKLLLTSTIIVLFILSFRINTTTNNNNTTKGTTIYENNNVKNNNNVDDTINKNTNSNSIISNTDITDNDNDSSLLSLSSLSIQQQQEECNLFPNIELVNDINFINEPGIWVLNDIILPQRIKASWNMYYNHVCDFIMKQQQHDDTKIMIKIIEIGTAYGGNANALATCISNSIIVSVDPFQADYDLNDLHSKNMMNWAKSHNNTLEEFSINWAKGLLYDQRIKHGCRYHLIKSFSNVAGNELIKYNEDDNNNKILFDVAFIDGLHTYDGVIDDINIYQKLVNPNGGIYIFNDYNSKHFPGVTKAVDEFVQTLQQNENENNIQFIIGTENIPPGPTNAAIVLPKNK